MSWRKFKTLTEVEKVEKVEKPPTFQDTAPFSTLNTFSSGNGDLKNTTPMPAKPSANLQLVRPVCQQQLSDEAERRADFCQYHRAMLGTCPHFDVIERLTTGDQAAALGDCLLWQLIRTGRNIEQAAPVEIVGGVTVGDVLAWVSVNAKDVEAIRNDRRLLLTCAESLQGAGHIWETLH